MQACLNLSLLFILEAIPYCFADYPISHIFFDFIIANGYAKHQNFPFVLAK